MSSPSAYSIDSGDSPRSSVETMRPERSGSHQRQDERQNIVMKLKNIPLSASDVFAPTEVEENPGTHKRKVRSPEQERYAGLLHSVDMMEGSFKYSGLALTPRIPGSVARARAIAASRLRSIKTQQSALRGHVNDIETPVESVPGTTSNTVTSAHQEYKPSDPIGKWRCCKCACAHDVYSFAHGQHPVSVLNCDCTHRSCSKCTLEGLLKPFVPMSEPEVVHLSEDANKVVRFGVFCDGCGLAWRAQEVHEDKNKKTVVKSALLRVSAIPRRLNKHDPHPLKNLRASKSMNNLLAPSPSSATMAISKSVLNLRALSNEMQKEYGKQADLVSVRFTGIKCSCGMTTDSTSLCFQIVDPPRDFYRVQFMKQMAGRRVAGFGTTPEDKARGHGTPTLVLRGGRRYPNPLMSNPVS
jgi:hypothetical protein